ncbi:hypothetical protein [Streptomyces sp. NPDC001070]
MTNHRRAFLNALSPQPPTPHQCDELCVCPVHKTPLIYWPAGNDHACQDAECRYGHGMAPTADPHPSSADSASASDR